MQYQEISIRVPDEIAKAFLSASDDDRRVAIRVFADYLKPRSKSKDQQAFDDARRKMSEEAKKSGLTPETLENILSEEG